MAPATEQTTVVAPVADCKQNIDDSVSANFGLAQDKQHIQDVMHSVFQKDFLSHPSYGRTEGAKPPALADVMHRDNRYFNEKASETVASFEYQPIPKPVLFDVHSKLSATNFKMDSDPSKVNSFETTHNTYFTPMNDPTRIPPIKNSRKSYIPQGDKEKIHLPLSNYRDQFRVYNAEAYAIEKAPPMHEGIPPTIKGDSRLVHFNTTHNDVFQGKWRRPVHTLPAPTGSSVPRGDPAMEQTTESTMQSSYPFLGNKTDHRNYEKSEVSGTLRKTNFKQEDGHYRWNDYKSTATSSYNPVSVKVERFRPIKHRNHSDFPEGDREPDRETERGNMTTSRFYHGDPPRGLHNTIISGANLRTKSNVQFSEPQLSRMYYDTTMDGQFKPEYVPYTYNRTKFYKDSAIPVHYYNDETHSSTTWNDYQHPLKNRVMPNPVAIENLKSSHIFPPLNSRQLNFQTTHNTTFTSKSAERHSYDAGRLHKSSVPLGTMNASAGF